MEEKTKFEQKLRKIVDFFHSKNSKKKLKKKWRKKRNSDKNSRKNNELRRKKTTKNSIKKIEEINAIVEKYSTKLKKLRNAHKIHTIEKKFKISGSPRGVLSRKKLKKKFHNLLRILNI